MLQFPTSINHKLDINIDDSLSFFRKFIPQKAVICFSPVFTEIDKILMQLCMTQ